MVKVENKKAHEEFRVKEKVILQQTHCPACTSRDAFTIWEQADGKRDGHCFSCKYHEDPLIEDEGDNNHQKLEAEKVNTRRTNFDLTTSQQESTKIKDLSECLAHPIREIPDRNISYSTCEKYGVRIGVDTRDGSTPIYHLYPFYDEDGELCGFKQRIVKDKNFYSIGHVKSDLLFGSNIIKSSGNKLFITEGELDCLSLYQALKENSSFDWEPQVVSLPNGSNSAIPSITANLNLINSFDQIILVLDQDKPGKEATKELCKLLAGKVYTVKLTEKDPNAMLTAGKAEDLKWAALTNAKKYQPDGIVNAKNCWARYKESSNIPFYPYPSFMSGVNDKIYGCTDGTIVTIASGTSLGKSTLIGELEYHYLKSTDHKIAVIALEEDIGQSMNRLVSIHSNKRLNLPNVNLPEETEKQYFEDLFSTGRVSLYDHFGGMDDDNLFSKLNYFIANKHKFIFLDHLSIIVSEYAAQGGERERIDTIMTKLAKLVKSTGAIIFLVVHLRKSDNSKTSFEEGAIPSLDDLRGSGSLKQLSWDVIGLSRNLQHHDPYCQRTTEIRVLKNRLTGRTGKAGFMNFSDETGRYTAIEEPEGYYI